MHEPEALAVDEDVSADQVVGGRPGAVLAQARNPGGERDWGVVAEDRNRRRQLACRRSERRQPVQHEPADRGWPDGLHLVGGVGRGYDPGRVQRPQELAQEQRVAPGCAVARAAELLGGVVPQPLPGQGLGRRLAQRPRIQRHRRGTRAQLRPHRAGLVGRGLRRTAGERHHHRKTLDPLRQVCQEAQRLQIGPLAVVDQHRQRLPIGQVDDQPVQAVQRLEARRQRRPEGPLRARTGAPPVRLRRRTGRRCRAPG